jgi:enoyl-CoA hydratase
MIELDRQGDIAVVTLAHGKVNALDLELLRELGAALGECEKAGAVVLTGRGAAFSAGVDLVRLDAEDADYLADSSSRGRWSPR